MKDLSSGPTLPRAGRLKASWIGGFACGFPLSMSVLRRTERVGHYGASLAHRLRGRRRGVPRRLVLRLGIDRGSDQDHGRGEPDPGHETDDRAERAVGFV